MDMLFFSVILVLVQAVVASNQISLSRFQSECYGIQIPYPFGIENSSTGATYFLEESFELTCNSTISNLIWDNKSVIAINVSQGQIDILISAIQICYDSRLGNPVGLTPPFEITNSLFFIISNKDIKYIVVGYSTFSYLTIYSNTSGSIVVCVTQCHNIMSMDEGHCSGNGCCMVDIPTGMTMVTIQVATYLYCSYSFVVKNGYYSFSKDHLENLPYQILPVVFDWSVGNKTCKESLSRGTNACKGNSTCVEAESGYGYRCQCNQGFEGNPYLHACTDINECDRHIHICLSRDNCLNSIGSYSCFCPNGQLGNGSVIGGCHEKIHRNMLPKIVTEESSRTTKIFTAEQLKKATNNYDDNLVVGRGGFGTVYKELLENDKDVAIKKSKTVNPKQVEQFINEVIILSQINRRNIVKLLGCCLETEVPLLVYEFVSNGIVFDFIRNENKRNNFNWKNRLKVAAEAAGALSYLHSAASIPIVHRDVKSANIFLDAKVSDFGTSRFIPLDQVALATMVQGTFGYLDPEFMQTSQLTEKNDVYSFGVVLAELLTGQKALSFERPEGKENLAIYFPCLKENRLFEALQVGILNEDNKQQIVEVANVTAKCLKLKGEERPYMKEVAGELEGIIMH
ncbi:hypothetical protein AHAS_Ahas06G0233200 [Arachis hypogaea]